MRSALLTASVLLVGCGSFSQDGTYVNQRNSQKLILLAARHQLVVIDSWLDYLDYTINGNIIVVPTPSGDVVGSLQGRSIVFPPVSSGDRSRHEVAWQLQGRWTRIIVFPFR